MFWNGGLEAILKFITLLNKKIRGQDLSTVSHKFGIIRNLIYGEALKFFDQNTQDRGIETNPNYELVMKYLITHFPPEGATAPEEIHLKGGVQASQNKKSQLHLPKLQDCGLPREAPSFWYW